MAIYSLNLKSIGRTKSGTRRLSTSISRRRCGPKISAPVKQPRCSASKPAWIASSEQGEGQ